MASAAPKLSAATVAELLAIPQAERFHEVIDGELVPKPMPSIRHGIAQVGIGDAIAGPHGPRARGRGPGGWVFYRSCSARSAATVASSSAPVASSPAPRWNRRSAAAVTGPSSPSTSPK